MDEDRRDVIAQQARELVALREKCESQFMDGYELAKDEYRPRLIEAEAENERLRAVVESKNAQFQRYARSMEKELNEAADELERMAAAIDLIRAEVLEEAARVAEYRCGSPEWSVDTNSGYDCAAKEIAAAIRALKEKQ